MAIEAIGYRPTPRLARLPSPVPSLSFLSATRHRDFRLFLIGQFTSLCGTWIQTVAQGWLVLQLTDSPFAVGLVTALGSLPILLLTLYGGVLADRVNRRRTVLLLQSLMVIEGLTLGILTLLHLVTVYWVIGLAIFFGILSAFEVPTRQALIADIVPRKDLLNAIALGSSAFNVARVIGPAIAGVLISTVGIAACFLINAASYLAVIASLIIMKTDTPPAVSTVPQGEALREGIRYIRDNPWPRALVTLVATFAVFGFPFMTMMPVFARDVLHLDAGGYGAMVSSVGIGAAVAALFMAAAGGRVPQPLLVLGSAISFGLVLTAAALAPGLLVGGGPLYVGGQRHGSQWNRGQQHAPDWSPRPSAGPSPGVLFLHGSGHGAVRVISGRLDSRAFRGARGDRARGRRCVSSWRR